MSWEVFRVGYGRGEIIPCLLNARMRGKVTETSLIVCRLLEHWRSRDLPRGLAHANSFVAGRNNSMRLLLHRQANDKAPTS